MIDRSPLVKGLLWISVAAATSLLLQACVPLVVGGVVKGVSMVRDRRSTGQQVIDQGIELKAAGKFSSEFASTASISNNSYQGKVLLTGEALSEKSRQKAAEIVTSLDGVKSVINEITVGPTLSFGDVSQDAWISSSVFTVMSTANGVPSRTIVTVVRKSNVYLMGLVTEAEATLATTVASRVNGVKSVNKVFDIISAQQAAKLDEQAGSTASGNNGANNAAAPIKDTDTSASSTTTSSGTDVQVMPIK